MWRMRCGRRATLSSTRTKPEKCAPAGRIFCESVAYNTEFLLERGYNRMDKIGKEGFSDVLHKKGQ